MHAYQRHRGRIVVEQHRLTHRGPAVGHVTYGAIDLECLPMRGLGPGRCVQHQAREREQSQRQKDPLQGAHPSLATGSHVNQMALESTILLRDPAEKHDDHPPQIRRKRQ